jgi:hypothetical protein
MEAEEPPPGKLGGSWQHWEKWSSRTPPSSSRRPARPQSPSSPAAADATGGGRAAPVAADSAPPPLRGRLRFAIRTPVNDGGGLRRFTLTQTNRWFYLVGSTAGGERARMLRIDREQDMSPPAPTPPAPVGGGGAGPGPGLVAASDAPLPAVPGLMVEIDPPDYERFVDEEGGRSTLATAEAFIKSKERGERSFRQDEIKGLLGAIRFTEGFYLVLIRDARHRADLGCHEIYKAEEMELMAVSAKTPATWSMRTPPEAQYKNRFFNAQVGKDCYWSYTYDTTHAVQFNMCDVTQPQPESREWKPQSMFLWNDYLLSNMVPVMSLRPSEGATSTEGRVTSWVNSELVLAVMNGHVAQKRLCLSGGRIVVLTLIARRSRHFAGTRYMKRGINNQGHVANEVETEQIVHEERTRVHPLGQHFTSFVQVRGSIPLFWTQKAAVGDPRPMITIQSQLDPSYHATKLHFANLVRRYGYPIVCLNLIKKPSAQEEQQMLQPVAAGLPSDTGGPDEGETDATAAGGGGAAPTHREVKLGKEYQAAFDHHFKSLPTGHAMHGVGQPLMEYVHWDLRKTVRGQAQSDEAHMMCENCRSKRATWGLSSDPARRWCSSCKDSERVCSYVTRLPEGVTLENKEDALILEELQFLEPFVEKLGIFDSNDVRVPLSLSLGAQQVRAQRQYRRGVVRSNCIDGLDRTNTAQFHMGLYALGHQLHALGVLGLDERTGRPLLNLQENADKRITIVLAEMFEEMGNEIALQYGGSEAHQFMVAKLEGHSQASSSLRDAYKSVRRYISNVITDSAKQESINLFLGKFQQCYAIGPTGSGSATDETGFPFHLWDLGDDFHLHNPGVDWPMPSRDDPLYAGSKAYNDIEQRYKATQRVKSESVLSGHWIRCALDEFYARIKVVSGLDLSQNMLQPRALSPTAGTVVEEPEPERSLPESERSEMEAPPIVAKRYGVLPSTMVRTQYRPYALTSFSDERAWDSAASGQALLLPPRMDLKFTVAGELASDGKGGPLVQTNQAGSEWCITCQVAQVRTPAEYAEEGPEYAASIGGSLSAGAFQVGQRVQGLCSSDWKWREATVVAHDVVRGRSATNKFEGYYQLKWSPNDDGSAVDEEDLQPPCNLRVLPKPTVSFRGVATVVPRQSTLGPRDTVAWEEHEVPTKHAVVQTVMLEYLARTAHGQALPASAGGEGHHDSPDHDARSVIDVVKNDSFLRISQPTSPPPTAGYEEAAPPSPLSSPDGWAQSGDPGPPGSPSGSLVDIDGTMPEMYYALDASRAGTPPLGGPVDIQAVPAAQTAAPDALGAAAVLDEERLYRMDDTLQKEYELAARTTQDWVDYECDEGEREKFQQALWNGGFLQPAVTDEAAASADLGAGGDPSAEGASPTPAALPHVHRSQTQSAALEGGGIDSVWVRQMSHTCMRYGQPQFKVQAIALVLDTYRAFAPLVAAAGGRARQLQLSYGGAAASHSGVHFVQQQASGAHTLELFLEDAVRGIEHLLCKALGRPEQWEALRSRYEAQPPPHTAVPELLELAGRAAPPGASQARVNLLGWVAFRARFPELRSVLRHFGLEHWWAVLRDHESIETCAQMQRLTEERLAMAQQRLAPRAASLDEGAAGHGAGAARPANGGVTSGGQGGSAGSDEERQRFLAVLRSPEFADFVVAGVPEPVVCAAQESRPPADGDDGDETIGVPSAAAAGGELPDDCWGVIANEDLAARAQIEEETARRIGLALKSEEDTREAELKESMGALPLHYPYADCQVWPDYDGATLGAASTAHATTGTLLQPELEPTDDAGPAPPMPESGAASSLLEPEPEPESEPAPVPASGS